MAYFFLSQSMVLTFDSSIKTLCSNHKKHNGIIYCVLNYSLSLLIILRPYTHIFKNYKSTMPIFNLNE